MQSTWSSLLKRKIAPLDQDQIKWSTNSGLKKIKLYVYFFFFFCKRSAGTGSLGLSRQVHNIKDLSLFYIVVLNLRCLLKFQPFLPYCNQSDRGRDREAHSVFHHQPEFSHLTTSSFALDTGKQKLYSKWPYIPLKNQNSVSQVKEGKQRGQLEVFRILIQIGCR